MEIEVSFIWLVMGLVMVALEVFAISGVGLLFAGLGALMVGLLLEVGYIAPDNISVQLVAFFGFTAAWTGMLWKPLQKMLKGKHADKQGYSDMVGHTATVAGKPLVKGGIGQASWSGTIMTCKLDDSSDVVEVPIGAPVEITAVVGSMLVVKPKS